MNASGANLLSKRVLEINVGFLLSTGPGNSKDMPLDINDPVQISQDLIAKHISGKLRLTRAKEGILAQCDCTIAVDRECNRCLDIFEQLVPVQVEELYAYPNPIAETEFFIAADGKLDLSILLRAEALIALSHQIHCKDDCKGLCAHCGTNLNHASCTCDADFIDPRLAQLKQLLDSQK